MSDSGKKIPENVPHSQLSMLVTAWKSAVADAAALRERGIPQIQQVEQLQSLELAFSEMKSCGALPEKFGVV